VEATDPGAVCLTVKIRTTEGSEDFT
jgi:hypothetical protein